MTFKDIVNRKKISVSTYYVCDMSDLGIIGIVDKQVVINSSRKELGFNEYQCCDLLKQVAKGSIQPDPNWITPELRK